MARTKWSLLCLLIALLLVLPCSTARALRSTGRSLVTESGTTASESDCSRQSGDDRVLTGPKESDACSEWRRFQERELLDYGPPVANPEPGIPPPPVAF